MALQGYGDDLAGRMNEVNLVDLFLHTVPQETKNYPILRNIYYLCLQTLKVRLII